MRTVVDAEAALTILAASPAAVAPFSTPVQLIAVAVVVVVVVVVELRPPPLPPPFVIIAVLYFD